MPAWEYCAVVGMYRNERKLEPAYPAVWYFTPHRIHIVEIKGREAEEVARIIAQLGQEGWEMVGAGNTGERSHALYFKRPATTSAG